MMRIGFRPKGTRYISEGKVTHKGNKDSEDAQKWLSEKQRLKKRDKRGWFLCSRSREGTDKRRRSVGSSVLVGMWRRHIHPDPHTLTLCFWRVDRWIEGFCSSNTDENRGRDKAQFQHFPVWAHCFWHSSVLYLLPAQLFYLLHLLYWPCFYFRFSY